MATITNTIKLTDEMSTTLRTITSQLEGTETQMTNTSTTSTAMGVAVGSVITQLATKVVSLTAEFVSLGDTLVNIEARLGLIVDEGQSVSDVNDQIYASAMRARGSYETMASTVSKLGLLAGDAFGDTDEIVAFSETLQKAFVVGGSSATEQTAAMYQLTQAMAAGKLQGDEYRSIMENAPMLAQAIADEMGVAQGDLKDLASEGLITSEIIKNAVFTATDGINEKFEEMPVTWEQQWTMMKSAATFAFSDVFTGVSSAMVSFSDLMIQNSDLIAAALIAIGVALAVVVIPQIYAAAVAFAVANTGAILIAVAVFVVIAAILRVPEVVGVVVGVFYVAYSVIENVLLAITEIFATVFNGISNVLANVVNYMANVFESPISSIIYLFQGMGDAALGVIEGIAKAMDFVFGSDMADTVSGWRSDLQSEADELVSSYAADEDYTKVVEAPLMTNTAERSNYGDSWDSGFTTGTDWANSVGDTLGAFTDAWNYEGIDEGTDMSDLLAGITTTNDLLDGEGSLESVGEVDISDESLKYLLDVASQNYQTAYQGKQVFVSMSTGDINSGTDENELLRKLETALVTALDRSLA